tara:strand:+ start:362 stop:676 length:315 start_codon:yes stop_codon:yes gene_type:complete
MTHKYDIRATKHDVSTGVISKITFYIHSTEGDYKWKTKKEVLCGGSPSDEGFVPFASASQADIENIIHKYLDKNTLESENSASLATYIEEGPYTEYSSALPPNV